MTLTQLQHASVGRPLTRGTLSLIPVYLHPSRDLGIATRSDRLTITEEEDASVPSLTVQNSGDRPILLTEGETVVGGKQNRVLNVSVLVPAHSTVRVPVSCVEAGRWGGASDFERGVIFAPRRLRRVKNSSVADNVRVSESRHSDQGAVWSMIDEELARFSLSSPTQALHVTEDLLGDENTMSTISSELVDLGPLPDQNGIIVTHGSRIVSAEIFATPDLLAANWAASIRAIVLDMPATASGRPSTNRALRFLHRITKGDATITEGVGLGREIHVRSKRFVGQALVLDDQLIHASAFALAV